MGRRRLVTRAPSAGRAWFERAVAGAVRLLDHEMAALTGHWAEVRERMVVARQSRDIKGLLSAQADLLPETRARLALDQRERRALLHSWIVDLRGRKAAA